MVSRVPEGENQDRQEKKGEGRGEKGDAFALPFHPSPQTPAKRHKRTAQTTFPFEERAYTASLNAWFGWGTFSVANEAATWLIAVILSTVIETFVRSLARFLRTVDATIDFGGTCSKCDYGAFGFVVPVGFR